jgi:hypothetical protein
MRQKGQKDVDITVKAIIIALKLFFDMPWVEMCSKLGVPDSTCFRVRRSPPIVYYQGYTLRKPPFLVNKHPTLLVGLLGPHPLADPL